MTIIDAISCALRDIGRPSTFQEIHDHIVKNKYYSFGAKSPVAVVRVKLRLHSDNVDILSGKGKVKYFHSEGGSGIDEKFSLLEKPKKNDNSLLMNKSKKKENKTVLKEVGKIEKLRKWFNKQDFTIHKSASIECFCMLLGSFLPIIIDSFLRNVLLGVSFDDAIRQNLKSGEVFLLTSALIMPFFFILINYMRSDDEHKIINKLPYFGIVFFMTLSSLLMGIFTFVYYRIGQLVRAKAESDIIKSMFGFDFGGWAIFIFIISLFVWYYASYMNHRSTDLFKKIRKEQQEELSNKFNATTEQRV